MSEDLDKTIKQKTKTYSRRVPLPQATYEPTSSERQIKDGRTVPPPIVSKKSSKK